MDNDRYEVVRYEVATKEYFCNGIVLKSFDDKDEAIAFAKSEAQKLEYDIVTFSVDVEDSDGDTIFSTYFENT